MRRNWDGILGVMIVVACAVWVGTAAQWATAACNTAGCSDTCKVHNRWCNLASIPGNPPKGFRYAVAIARTGRCSQAPDGGTPIELDLIAWDRYPDCAKDCPQDTACTGSPSGDKEASGTFNVETKCKSS